MDDDQLGEFAYDHVEVRRDYLAWTPGKGQQVDEGHDIPPALRHGIGEQSATVEGQKVSDSDSNGGLQHTGVMGDGHGVATEDEQKAARGP